MALAALVKKTFSTISLPSRYNLTTGKEALFSVVLGAGESRDWQIDLQTGSLNEFLAFEFSRIPEVESVYTALRNRVFYVWIVIDQFEPEVRRKIYKVEQSIIEDFNRFEFDFYIVARMGQPSDNLISGSVDRAYP